MDSGQNIFKRATIQPERDSHMAPVEAIIFLILCLYTNKLRLINSLYIYSGVYMYSDQEKRIDFQSALNSSFKYLRQNSWVRNRLA